MDTGQGASGSRWRKAIPGNDWKWTTRGTAQRPLGQMLAANDADHASAAAEGSRDLHDAEPGNRVEKHRQDHDHEERAPVAELVLKLSQPNQANDGPPH